MRFVLNDCVYTIYVSADFSHIITSRVFNHYVHHCMYSVPFVFIGYVLAVFIFSLLIRHSYVCRQ